MRSPSVRKVVASLASALTAGAVALALLNPGVVTQEVDLHDGGVWVTNQRMRMLGHLNYSSQVIDGGLRTESTSFDVDQEGPRVFLAEADADTYTQVDITNATLGAPVSNASDMDLGGSRVAYADPKAGKVWVMDASAYSSFDPTTSTPAITGESGVVMAIGQDGSIHAASAATKRVTTLTRAGSMTDKQTEQLGGVESGAKLQITAVGSKSVVLDVGAMTLHLPDGVTAKISGRDPVLQVPGPDADEVLVSTQGALLRVGMDGSVESVANPVKSGTPTAPVQHGGCAYAAWSKSGAIVRDCEETGRDIREKAPELNKTDSLVFRENRKVIVLNNMSDGGLWLPDNDMKKVDNWDEINAQLEEKEKEDDDTTRDDATQDQRSKENSPPQAVDDSFGVRPGRSASLPVLWNDTDPDGDVLTASPTSQPSFAEVSAVNSGAALQARVADGASGTSSFTYQLSDGRATDEATVQLEVHPWSVNEGPKQLRESNLVLGQEASVSTNVSGDWLDPDGDPIFLESVTGPETLQLSWRADGTVTVTDLGQAPGVVDLTVTYSDGRATTDGVLHVEVRGGENIAPVANGDHVVVQEGQTTQFDPRINDSDANGDPLRVAALGDVPSGISADFDPALSTVTVTGHKAGSYYLEYVITDGPASARGIIRIDVVAATTDAPPVTQDDVATLPQGGQTIVAALDNDTDPSGGVLVLQSATVPTGSPLVVSVVDHHMLRVTAPGGLTDTQEFTYTVANASGSASGRVLVIPAPAVALSDPPVLADDTLTVRVGDIASVSVLANDRSPSGLSMTVQDNLQHQIPGDVAVPFVSGNRVRVRAGTKPGSGVIIYTVRDSAGNVASARVQLNVVGMDEAANQAPRPREVTAWAVAGQKVTVTIPLDGIDPDGDSVTLEGLVTSPKLGVAQLDETSLTYIPGTTSSGTDVFSYTVRDRLGASATATIRIGVAPAAAQNQRPVAVADQVQVRPGTTVLVPVLDNDVDPDGDELTLVADSAKPATKGVAVETVRSKVRVTAPSKEGAYVVEYEVTDSRSEPVSGMLTLLVAREAPKRAPVARDDAVTLRQALEEDQVSVPVLDNDSDPDGDITADELSSRDPGVTVEKGGRLRIAIQPTERYVMYTVTDPDGLHSSALVYVPGNKITMPEIDPKAATDLKVRAGEKVEIPLDKYVLTRDGRKPKITDSSKVTAAVGWDGSSLVKNKETLVFGADPRYSGPSSITFEVTDGKSATDPAAKVAMLTLPITVLPGDVNRPPTLRPTAIEVAAGEDPITVDMRQWAEDPDEGDLKTLRYRLTQTPAGIQASASGSTLTISAAGSTKRGEAGALTVEVTDSARNQVTTSVPVTVVASRKPLIQVSKIPVSMNAGESQTVDLSKYVVNPFPGTPVKVVGTPSVEGKVNVKVSGTSLVITAPEKTNGSSTISFRLADKTGDESREVTGQVEVTVLDKPDAPTEVKASSAAASVATISWKAGAANGSPISTFTVFDETQGDSKKCGLVTECLFEGRTNGQDHTFHVVATNAVGDSEPSAKATTNIDVVPGKPDTPSVTPGDGSVTVEWKAPTNEGSAITGYTVMLSGDKSQTATVKDGTSHTFTGLTNGSSYTATVMATNAKGDSEQSNVSAAVRPYGDPDPVQNLVARVMESSGDRGTIEVTWSAPASLNGGKLKGYNVTSARGGGAAVHWADTNSMRLENVTLDGDSASFSVVAIAEGQDGGERQSDVMATSVVLRGSVPAPGGTLSLKPTGNDGEVIVSGVHARGNNGWGAGSQTLQWSTGGEWHNLDASGKINVGVNQTVNVSVRSVASADGNTVASESLSGTVNPYGIAVMKTAECHAKGPDEIECSWQGTDGKNRPVARVEVSEGITKTIKGGAAGSVTQSGLSPHQTVKVCFTPIQEADGGERPGTKVCPSATTTTPTVNTYSGRAVVLGDGVWIADDGSEGTMLGLMLSGYRPGAAVQCHGRYRGRSFEATITMNGDGAFHSDDIPWSVDGTRMTVASMGSISWKQDANLQCDQS